MNGKLEAVLIDVLREPGDSLFQTAEKIVKAVSDQGFEIVERSSLDALSEAVRSRASLAAIGLVIEHAKKGDIIDGWPPLLSPPPSWRKESWSERGRDLGQGVCETITKARIIKE